MSVGPGTVLAERYELGEVLGRGGMGAVYAGIDQRLGRPVAVKLLLDALTEDRTVTLRFEREARAAGSLSHPAIAQVYDYGRCTGPAGESLQYIVMERIDGRTLGRVLAEGGKMPLSRALPLMAQLLSALGTAHAARVVHRDLKPGNVMIVRDPASGEERVKIIDFGIAAFKESDAYTRLTQTGMILGTPSFMSPEQALGQPSDARSDLYAAGVLSFCMLTGQKPFAHADLGELVRAVLLERPPRIDTLAPEIPAAIADVVARALEKDPVLRPASAAEFLRALPSFDATTPLLGSMAPAAAGFASASLVQSSATHASALAPSMPTSAAHPSGASWAPAPSMHGSPARGAPKTQVAAWAALAGICLLTVGAAFAGLLLLFSMRSASPMSTPSDMNALVRAAERVRSNDFRGCLDELRGAEPTEAVLNVRMSCAFQVRDRADLEATCALFREQRGSASECESMLRSMDLLAGSRSVPMAPPTVAPGPVATTAPRARQLGTPTPVTFDTHNLSFDDALLSTVLEAARPSIESCAVEEPLHFTLLRHGSGGGTVDPSEEGPVSSCVAGALTDAIATLQGGSGLASITVSRR